MILMGPFQLELFYDSMKSKGCIKVLSSSTLLFQSRHNAIISLVSLKNMEELLKEHKSFSLFSNKNTSFHLKKRKLLAVRAKLHVVHADFFTQ